MGIFVMLTEAFAMIANHNDRRIFVSPLLL